MSSAEMQAITGFRAGSCNVREPSGERVIRRDTVRDRTLCGRNVEPSSVQNAVLQQRWPGSPQVQTSIMTHWTPIQAQAYVYCGGSSSAGSALSCFQAFPTYHLQMQKWREKAWSHTIHSTLLAELRNYFTHPYMAHAGTKIVLT